MGGSLNTIVYGGDSIRGITKLRSWNGKHKLYTHIYYHAMKAMKVREELVSHVTRLNTMGVLLFGLIGGEFNRSLERWGGSKELYELARKATFPERELRFQSIKDFYKEWQESS